MESGRREGWRLRAEWMDRGLDGGGARRLLVCWLTAILSAPTSPLSFPALSSNQSIIPRFSILTKSLHFPLRFLFKFKYNYLNLKLVIFIVRALVHLKNFFKKIQIISPPYKYLMI
jgi:hypothetical protein